MASHEVKSEVTGAVWKFLVAIGDTVEPGDPIMIVESMKMEIPVISEDGGTMQEFCVAEGASVSEGQVVAVLTR